MEQKEKETKTKKGVAELACGYVVESQGKWRTWLWIRDQFSSEPKGTRYLVKQKALWPNLILPGSFAHIKNFNDSLKTW